MNSRRFFLITIIVLGVIIGLATGLNFYLSEKLYIKPESDQDLIETLLDVENPGYQDIKILQSDGVGIRRIPRQILIEVTMQSVPEPMTCTGEIFYAVGDPMALNLQWHTLHCIGQHLLMNLSHTAMTFGVKPTSCHGETIINLLVHWTRTGVIELPEINSPEFRDLVQSLAEDETYSVTERILDGGLYNVPDAIVHNRMGDADGEGFESNVLRCDGTLDLYLAPVRGQVYEYAQIGTDDYLLPTPLQKGSVSILSDAATQEAERSRETGVEVTAIPAESCTGWTCQVHGTVYSNSSDHGKELSGAEIILSHTSYCSPTRGQLEGMSNSEGTFSFEVFLHDTDLLTVEITAADHQSQTLTINGMDCLNCACFPLDIVLVGLD
jgi:hypothetical protein